MRVRGHPSLIVLLVVLLSGGCGSQPPAPSPRDDTPAPEPEAVGEASEVREEASSAPAVDVTWLPPYFHTPEDRAHYYISRLSDRRFTQTYGGVEHPRTWYTAAEQLGQLGELAIPLLFARIETHDPYELMLVLYALQLASQDPAVMAQTGGDALLLGTVLTESTNHENRIHARAWWERHRHRWEPRPGHR
ncbi:hypothetical protein [Halomonas heilongjiangensis]|uniref:Lytic transglycosylase n=1 Tax=Halomonas heilongjiangensis TaxID=1387883 RepID=A0A2N7TT82_9GAMM|nr:hypothetical protein [Halomonas heilongjiangensis]PMR71399.1 hypothetical protein C1H66_02970 [Halomonas heilongjiangensis]PXX88670.1 hypothetical protein CR158_14035 [Halomonas heilongjiangensis]